MEPIQDMITPWWTSQRLFCARNVLSCGSDRALARTVPVLPILSCFALSCPPKMAQTRLFPSTRIEVAHSQEAMQVCIRCIQKISRLSSQSKPHGACKRWRRTDGHN